MARDPSNLRREIAGEGLELRVDQSSPCREYCFGKATHLHLQQAEGVVSHCLCSPQVCCMVAIVTHESSWLRASSKDFVACALVLLPMLSASGCAALVGMRPTNLGRGKELRNDFMRQMAKMLICRRTSFEEFGDKLSFWSGAKEIVVKLHPGKELLVLWK